MPTFLGTERLVLRRITADDADALFELDLDPELTYNINGGQPTPRDEVQKDFIPYFLEFYNKYAGFGFWAAIEKESDAFPGWFHIRPREDRPAGEIELGYRLNNAAWGKSYVTEGSRAFIDKGFFELGIKYVVASAFAANVRSRRVLEECGLTLVRTYQVDWPLEIEGIEQGVVEYALTKEQRQNPRF